MNKDAILVPAYYTKSYKIDNKTNQLKIGNPNHLILDDRLNFSENNSFKNISIPEHICLYISNKKETIYPQQESQSFQI
jgi:hypothetical protein